MVVFGGVEPSDTLDAKSNTPTTGFVTALRISEFPLKRLSHINPSDVPDKSFAYAFEETKSTFRFGTFNWFQLHSMI